MILWRGMVPLFGDVNYASEAILAMDEWLAAVEADPSNDPFARKILEHRPASVDHRCTNGNGQALPSEACDAVVQSYSSARIEAGMPFTDDVVKCQLKPLRESDFYPAQFNGAQRSTLKATFPDGVCDYRKPAVEYRPTVPWQSYEDGPGGRPLGDPPVSMAFG